MATLERREQSPGNVSYRVRWRADGKQRSKSFKGHADAKRWKAVLEGDLVNGSYMDPKDGQVTVASFINEHRTTLTLDVRISTRVRVEGIYDGHIIPEFGHLPLSAITTPLVGAWVNNMMLSMSNASVRKNAHVLSKVFDLATSYGLVRANPVTPVRLPAEDKREQLFLNHTQAWALAEAIHPRFKAMVLVAVFGGLRAGEISALRRKHIIPERNQIAVRETLVDVQGQPTFGPPKTKTSVRLVTIPRSIMADLVTHMTEYTGKDTESLVFTGERGNVVRRSWFHRYYWAPATQAAGVEGLRFHDLRHTFVALWVSLGRNAKEVSKAAGHSSVAFTLDRYGHLYDTDSDELADELDTLLASARPGLTRPHDVAETGQNNEIAVRPPSSSGPGPRPFTALPDSSRLVETRRSETHMAETLPDFTQTQATTGHTLAVNPSKVRPNQTRSNPMGRQTVTVIADDLDGKELPAETQPVSLSLGRTTYNLYLSDKNHGKLLEALTPFIENAEKVAGSATRSAASSTDKEKMQKVRAWAQATKYTYKNAKGEDVTLGDRGRIPAEIVEAYDAAN